MCCFCSPPPSHTHTHHSASNQQTAAANWTHTVVVNVNSGQEKSKLEASVAAVQSTNNINNNASIKVQLALSILLFFPLFKSKCGSRTERQDDQQTNVYKASQFWVLLRDKYSPDFIQNTCIPVNFKATSDLCFQDLHQTAGHPTFKSSIFNCHRGVSFVGICHTEKQRYFLFQTNNKFLLFLTTKSVGTTPQCLNNMLGGRSRNHEPLITDLGEGQGHWSPGCSVPQIRPLILSLPHSGREISPDSPPPKSTPLPYPCSHTLPCTPLPDQTLPDHPTPSDPHNPRFIPTRFTPPRSIPFQIHPPRPTQSQIPSSAGVKLESSFSLTWSKKAPAGVRYGSG